MASTAFVSPLNLVHGRSVPQSDLGSAAAKCRSSYLGGALVTSNPKATKFFPGEVSIVAKNYDSWGQDAGDSQKRRSSSSNNPPKEINEDSMWKDYKEGTGLTQVSFGDNPKPESPRPYNEEWYYTPTFKKSYEFHEKDDRGWWWDDTSAPSWPTPPAKASQPTDILEGLQEREDVKRGKSKVDLTKLDQEPLRSRLDLINSGYPLGREIQHETRVSSLDNILEGLEEREAVKEGRSNVDITNLDNMDPRPEPFWDGGRLTDFDVPPHALQAESIEHIIEGVNARRTLRDNPVSRSSTPRMSTYDLPKPKPSSTYDLRKPKPPTPKASKSRVDFDDLEKEFFEAPKAKSAPPPPKPAVKKAKLDDFDMSLFDELENELFGKKD
eukprot:CAMPEP_0196651696 /NCGR_PEP_ID=MMETSP1086-20130531/754_1 /TAXON_ID=77921 /ORGANISM="Cyanoptyche  gloeocystis , Strain SAG4.97" /LENGTH=382 /DNA_ID=CAMNT_0041981829 /DNA_START=78 /DNA_END=1226 /DNA_ORIENTATION=+